MKLIFQPRQKSKLDSDDFESWSDLTLNKNIMHNISFNVYKQVIQQWNTMLRYFKCNYQQNLGTINGRQHNIYGVLLMYVR